MTLSSNHQRQSTDGKITRNNFMREQTTTNYVSFKQRTSARSIHGGLTRVVSAFLLSKATYITAKWSPKFQRFELASYGFSNRELKAKYAVKANNRK